MILVFFLNIFFHFIFFLNRFEQQCGNVLLLRVYYYLFIFLSLSLSIRTRGLSFKFKSNTDFVAASIEVLALN